MNSFQYECNEWKLSGRDTSNTKTHAWMPDETSEENAARASELRFDEDDGVEGEDEDEAVFVTAAARSDVEAVKDP